MPTATATFAAEFAAAFERLRRVSHVNLVPLADLRAALPAYDRASFDRELYELRRQNLYVLDTHDGRHGKASAAQVAAAIDEGGRRYVYVCRRSGQ